ncbi:MAG: YaiO family outer membrane beta-barrel protein [Nitrospirae bacterium]|nr:YaiO family outer membrane beta-barrel protein [Nitrospirota bacterium]
MTRLQLWFALLALHFAIPEADADEFPWKASARYEYSRFERDRDDWHAATLSAERRWDRGSLALEGFRLTRFDRWDQGVALDGYLDLWPRAYGNLRFQAVADPDVMPTTDALAEIFQGLPRSWEFSMSYRNMRYADDTVHLIGLSPGQYLGNWYLRERVFFVPSHGELGFLGVLAVRYVMEDAENFVEVSGGWGRQVILLGSGPETELRKNGHGLLRGQRFFTRHWGAMAHVGLDAAERTPAALNLMAAALSRW